MANSSRCRVRSTSARLPPGGPQRPGAVPVSQRVNAGDKVATRADDWNTLLEVADEHRRTRAGVDGPGLDRRPRLAAFTAFAFRDPDDDDLAELCPVKLRFPDGDPYDTIEPSDAPLDWTNQPVFLALTPEAGDEAEAVGITAEPIKAGAIGRVYVAGVTSSRSTSPTSPTRSPRLPIRRPCWRRPPRARCGLSESQRRTPGSRSARCC